MKHCSAALVALFSLACSEEADLSSGQLPPPGATPDFVVGEMLPGSDLTMAWAGLPPGATVYFAASAAGLGAGPCPPLLAGTCLEVVRPVMLGTATANAQGVAGIVRRVPATLASGIYHFQAVARTTSGVGLLSNTFERGTGPGFCPFIYDPVCGHDGVTYDNECIAHAFGTPVASWGACP